MLAVEGVAGETVQCTTLLRCLLPLLEFLALRPLFCELLQLTGRVLLRPSGMCCVSARDVAISPAGFQR
jgi:hypothetical protein